MTYSHLFTPTRRGLHRAGALGAAHVAHNVVRRKHKTKSRSTMTSTKKEEKMHGDDVHSGLTSTGYKIVLNKKQPKSVDKGRAFQYVENSQGKLQGSTPGPYQDVKTICSVGSTNQALTITNNVVFANAGPALALVPYRNLNPNVYYTGSDFYGTVANAQAMQLEKIFLKSVGIDLRVVNLTNFAAEVDIYVYRAKQNSNVYPDVLWNKCAVSHGLGKGQATVAGVATGYGEDVGYPSNIYVGSNPYLFKEFNKFFQTVKVHHINLAAAAEEKIHFQVLANYMIDFAKILQLNPNMNTQVSATWTEANTTMKTLKGQLYIMMVARGGLVETQDALNSIANGPTQIGYTYTKHHSFRTVAKTVQQIDPVVIDNNIPNSILPGKIINIVDVSSNTVNV